MSAPPAILQMIRSYAHQAAVNVAAQSRTMDLIIEVYGMDTCRKAVKARLDDGSFYLAISERYYFLISQDGRIQ